MKKPKREQFTFTADYQGATDHRGQAMCAAAAAISMIAKRFDVCPLCLTYNLAAATEEAENSGDLPHHDKEPTLQ
jgi:hypothetical protein